MQPAGIPARLTAAPARRAARRQWIGYLFILPNFVGFAIFTLLPLLFALLVAFTKWNLVAGFRDLRFVGLANFRLLLTDQSFHDALAHTAVYVGVSVPVSLAFGLLTALALNGRVAGRAALRAIFFLPFISNVVAISAVWILLYHPTYGPINAGLRAVGVANPPAWLASSAWVLPALIIMAIWGAIGYNAVIYLAGLQDIPRDLYDAAAIDGAGALARFRAVTLPLLTPTLFFLIVTSVIGTSQAFGQINLMTKGGPGDASTVLAYYIYETGFQFFQLGYASALAWFLFVAILLFTLVLWLFQRRGVFYYS